MWYLFEIRKAKDNVAIGRLRDCQPVVQHPSSIAKTLLVNVTSRLSTLKAPERCVCRFRVGALIHNNAVVMAATTPLNAVLGLAQYQASHPPST